jgi:hypothetical protein
MPYPKFDRSRLLIKKLSERKNKIDIRTHAVDPGEKPRNLSPAAKGVIEKTAGKIRAARENGSSVILAFGAHTIKNGLSPVLIALMRERWVTHLATNGAGIIHDWEFAFQGKSSEDVRENVEKGQFGIWDETGFYIGLALVSGAYEGRGYGESVGKMIAEEGLNIPGTGELLKLAADSATKDPVLAASSIGFSAFIRQYNLEPGFMKIPHPFREYSVQAASFTTGVPFTGHPMIGHDIIYTHPAIDGAAVGRTAMNDFLSYALSVSNIENGVYISLGSSVMSPMIFEKSLSMAQNIMIQEGRHIDNHYMLVADLAQADWDWSKGEPPADNPAYYLRYCKTFSRMGGEMDYLSIDNRDFLPALYQKLNE